MEDEVHDMDKWKRNVDVGRYHCWQCNKYTNDPITYIGYCSHTGCCVASWDSACNAFERNLEMGI